MKPTDEQVKEVWERCGQERYYCGKEIDIQHFPRIDLNNLFEYAVPIQKKKTFLLLWVIRIMQDWAEGKQTDPALALFWAIYEVIK